MRKWMLILFMAFAFHNAFSQEFEMIRHQVQMGETVRMISRKYKVEPSEIYRLNKFAIDGISKGMILQIMVPKKEEKVAEVLPPPETSEDAVVQNTNATTDDNAEKTVTTQTTTTVRKKKPKQEPVAQTEKSVASEQTLQSDASPPPVITPSENTGQEIKHTVAKGETLFSLARKYNVKVDDIKTQNADVLKKGLQPGQVLTINSNQSATEVQTTPENTVAKKETVTEPETKIEKSETPATDNSGQEVKHTVSKGETLFSLSKRYNVSVDDIKSQNADALKKGLQIGQVLTIMAKN
ncbi:MAG TPA: LysM peptidoglycan-binding domain-containing protein [Flavobacterium sp.]|nr:LysM peptidoglycan-binding domain-containing protein [Flavobacterium sp.]